MFIVMTHYFENILPKVLSYSQKLDKLALLLNEPWVVVGDHNVQSKLIFRTAGSVLISENGIVTFGKWELLNRANSILIEYTHSIRLYNQAFFDEAILALRLDGTQDFFILVNQNKIPDLNIVKYINDKYTDKIKPNVSTNNHIESTTFTYITDKGAINVCFKDTWRRAPYIGDVVTMNNRPAPDGKYRIDFADYIHVKNGRIYKTTMF